MWQVLGRYLLKEWVNHLLRPFTDVKDNDYKDMWQCVNTG